MCNDKQEFTKCDACGCITNKYIELADYKLCPACTKDFDENVINQIDNRSE